MDDELLVETAPVSVVVLAFGSEALGASGALGVAAGSLSVFSLEIERPLRP